ncbi:hypothetical protein ACLI1A_12230 [Flavobacterium sp. RHBU_3]|uniref:hypothetical protein n=1 Tax=Flavobacterium sp. RHBU_3 TaxID=3391184 RepID=UPI00398513EE
MKKYILFLLFNVAFANAQDTPYEYKNSVIAELFGNSYGFVSINYERVLYSAVKKPDIATLRVAARVGIGFGDRVSDSISSYNFPVEFTAMYGRTNNIEASMGITPCIGKEVTDTTRYPAVHFNRLENVVFLRLGYRYWENGGLIFRVAPMLQFPSQLHWKPELTMGLSVGYNFY